MKADRVLFTITSFLILISIILDYSLASFATILFETSHFHFVIRQALFGLISISLMFCLSQLDPDKWFIPIGSGIFAISILLMVTMPFLPESYVSAVGGAKRWIKVFGFSLAPIEFFKVGFVFFISWSFSRKINYHHGMGIKKELIRFLPYAVFFLVVMYAIAVIQNDLGQVIVLGFTLIFLLLLSGSSFKFFSFLFSSVIVAFIFFILTSQHRIDRVMSWWSIAQNTLLKPFSESFASKFRVPVDTIPYQIGNSVNAIHNGSLFGVGLGNGNFKLGFLSEVHTDFVLAGLSEEFGYVGLLFVTFLFMFIIQRIFKIANRLEDKNLYLFCIGIALVLSFAFLINAYGISGILPIKGISVPFLSYGGSAMIGASFGVGMVLMLSNKAKMENTIQ